MGTIRDLQPKSPRQPKALAQIDERIRHLNQELDKATTADIRTLLKTIELHYLELEQQLTEDQAIVMTISLNSGQTLFARSFFYAGPQLVKMEAGDGDMRQVALLPLANIQAVIMTVVAVTPEKPKGSIGFPR